ncbi:MAG TPA: hypothetical protein VHL80_02305 [Polyangia bacterium]|nr:hypothetical protein [Polyangia bacterium]
MSRTAQPPRFVVCEDGAEYIERFRRFLGGSFAFVPARDLGGALEAIEAAGRGAGAAVDGLLLDLDFRRTPPGRLVDESGRALAGAPLDEGGRRRLTESQGIFILRALRARGIGLPAVLFADLADAEQAGFLERTLAPLVVASSRTGLGEVAALLGRLASRAT